MVRKLTHNTNNMATLTGKIAADFRTSLATELGVGGTSATLQSATDDDGVALPAGKYYFTTDGNNSQKEHISCDLSGTAITNIKSVSRQGVQTSGVVRKHRIGASVVITDFAHIQVINDLINGTTDLNASDPLKYDGTATISDDAHLATKKYVDDTAVAGAPDATTGVKGLVEIATGAELAAGTGTGGTGAKLVPGGDSFKNTSAGAGDTNKVPVLDAAGRLDNSFMPTIYSRTADQTQITTAPDSANDAVRKDYVDTQLDGRITAAQATAIKTGPASDASEYHFHRPSYFTTDMPPTSATITDNTNVYWQGASNPDGSRIVAVWKQAAANQSKYGRVFSRDTTGNYYTSTAVSNFNNTGSSASSQYASVAMGTTYIWIASLNGGGTDILITRYASDLTGAQVMTISGAANVDIGHMCGNDNVLYVGKIGATATVAVYTISGTTATRGADITLGDTGATRVGMWFDGTDIVYATTSAIKRYTVAGSLVNSLTRYYVTGSLATGRFVFGFAYRSTADIFLLVLNSDSEASNPTGDLEGIAVDLP